MELLREHQGVASLGGGGVDRGVQGHKGRVQATGKGQGLGSAYHGDVRTRVQAEGGMAAAGHQGAMGAGTEVANDRCGRGRGLLAGGTVVVPVLQRAAMTTGPRRFAADARGCGVPTTAVS